ncbi:MAG: hypothetical protein JSR28_10055 [Proteobacteria bacterium]|nr:hypothetical protein [Pseudomonadota bacterium]
MRGAARAAKRGAMARGYQVLFHADSVNHCPGCNATNWLVGRITAECGRCGTALPLAEAVQSGLDTVGQKPVVLHLLAGGKPYRERRREKRVSATGREVTLHIDGAPRAFAVEDISTGGVKGAVIEDVFKSRQLIVELEDGTLLPAELRWRSGGFIGLEFVKPTTA